MKRYRIREQMNGIAEPPGKVWFWELEAGVIHADRCIQCGTCVAVCPSNSIGIDEDTNLPELVKMCTGCSLCWDFCPRGGLRYEALWPPSTLADGEDAEVQPAQVRSDSSDTYWKISGGPPAEGLGAVVDSYAVRASAQLDDVQDGGAVSALLIGLLAAGEIDGALVSKPSDDPDEQWKGIATVATTADEIRAASGSFYNQTMALAELDLSRYALPPKPRIAVVGTPCEVQGLRAMQARRWPTGAHRVDAVVLTIALMCTKNFDYEALTLKELRDKRGVDLDRVSKMDVIRGRMIVEYRDGELAVDEPVKDFHGAALKGCDECADFLGRSADISVGSVGSMNGWTSVIIRTERGRLAFQAARAKLDVRGLDDPAALLRLDALDKKIANRSLQRKLDPTRHCSSTSTSTSAPTTGPTAGPSSSAIDGDGHPGAARARRAHGPGRGLAGRGPRRRTDRAGPDGGRRLRGLAVDPLAVPLVGGRRRGRPARDRPRLPAGDLAVAGGRADVVALLFRSHRQDHPAHRGARPRRGVTGGRRHPPAIALTGVTVRRDGVPVLSEVDWRVETAERWVILGPNGSGKTTLLQVASARLWPTAGTVEVLGARLGQVDVRTLRPRVALVSGAVTRQLRSDLLARDVVVSGRHAALETWWNRYTDDDWEKADGLLARSGMGAIGDRPFGVISEGERQQVLLARALMGDPELVLLDEPFAGLDLGARERLLLQLGALAADVAGPPVVLVTHHCEEIPSVSPTAGSWRVECSGRPDPWVTSSTRRRCPRVSRSR